MPMDILQRWHSSLYQGCHGEFEPGKVQYYTQNIFDRLFHIRVYWNPKSRPCLTWRTCILLFTPLKPIESSVYCMYVAIDLNKILLVSKVTWDDFTKFSPLKELTTILVKFIYYKACIFLAWMVQKCKHLSEVIWNFWVSFDHVHNFWVIVITGIT